MTYYEPHDATKCGYRPLDEAEWILVIGNGTVISDNRDGGVRTRLVLDGGRWYVWKTEPGPIFKEVAHECFEITDGKTRITRDDYDRLKHLFADIFRFG